MSKLSPSLKALINAPFARPGQTPAPRHIRDVYARIALEARERKYGERPWVTLSAAATYTLNSPASLLILHDVASTSPHANPRTGREHAHKYLTRATTLTPLAAADLLREIGLKCISFNGIPRTINCLGAFRAGLLSHPQHAWIVSALPTAPTREVNEKNVESVRRRGRELWKSIYDPFDEKLEGKLGESHPDLPVHILGSHYGPLLADPELTDGQGEGGKEGGGWERQRVRERVGRCLTSVVATACLRAQTGVGPQVLSHVFGLRKGVEQGMHREEFRALDVLAEEEGERTGVDDKKGPGEEEAEGVERLAGDEGCEWMLRSVDAIAEAIGGSFARWDGEWQREEEGSPRESKL